MNAELLPLKTGEHNSESVSTLDRDITPLIRGLIHFHGSKGWCVSVLTDEYERKEASAFLRCIDGPTPPM